MNLRSKVVRVEGLDLDEPVFVRRWSFAQKRRVLDAIKGEVVSDEAKVEIVINSACNADGAMLFNEANRQELEDLDWIAITLIATAAMDLNTLEKKTASVQSESLSSNSLPASA